jgi:thiopeptide-type bacteriocin biosynthesis protein
LFLKIYTSPPQTERVLTGPLRAAIEFACEKELVDRWFFVRYADPRWHIRLRLHGEERRLWTEVFPLLRQGLAEYDQFGVVHSYEVSTYFPEAARYGGTAETLYLAERVFHADSVFALAAMSDHARRWPQPRRLLLAAQAVHTLLTDFGLELPQRASFVNVLRDAMGERLGVSPRFRHEVGRRYRTDTRALQRLIKSAPEDPLLVRRSQAMADTVHRLHKAFRSGEACGHIHDVLASMIHMSANRLFSVTANLHEYMTYEYLGRHYRSVEAQGRLQ